MKILTNEQFSALKSKAESYDKVVDHITSNSEGITAEDVNTEAIIDMIKPADSADTTQDNPEEITELKRQVENLTGELQKVQSDKVELQNEVEVLKGLPAVEDSSRTPQGGEHEENVEDVLDFAKKNKGNTALIVAEIRRIGLA